MQVIGVAHKVQLHRAKNQIGPIIHLQLCTADSGDELAMTVVPGGRLCRTQLAVNERHIPPQISLVVGQKLAHSRCIVRLAGFCGDVVFPLIHDDELYPACHLCAVQRISIECGAVGRILLMAFQPVWIPSAVREEVRTA